MKEMRFRIANGVDVSKPFSATIRGGNREPLIITDMEQKQKITLPKELEGKKFRVRKLTPRELLRLMDCEEKDIDTMLNCGLSNSSLYRLAGNSICVGVLEKIFYKMFINQENENQQLSLW